MQLEICAYNIQSCLIAHEAGADRIELCAGPLQGGTTPSYGFIKHAIDKISIPVYPIIRPRGGDFCYTADELAIMEQDIYMCRELGCRGISTGVSLPDGSIDVATMRKIFALAGPMEVTCHKVFDATPDIFKALEDVIAACCSRVLTSGGQGNAIDNIGNLTKLIALAGGRITIMPGGGVRSGNIAQLAKQTKAMEYHSSAVTINDGRFISDSAEIYSIINSTKA